VEPTLKSSWKSQSEWARKASTSQTSEGRLCLADVVQGHENTIRGADAWNGWRSDGGQYGVRRYPGSHLGIDLVAKDGGSIQSPFPAKEVEIITGHEDFEGSIVLQGMEEWSEVYVKLSHLLPVSSSSGMIALPGTILGHAKSMRSIYPGMTDHIHLELFHGSPSPENVMDPTDYMCNSSMRPVFPGWHTVPYILQPVESSCVEFSKQNEAAWFERLDISTDPAQECASRCMEEAGPSDIMKVVLDASSRCACIKEFCSGMANATRPGFSAFQVIGETGFKTVAKSASGRCKDAVDLPEGPHAARFNMLVDPVQECAVRCTHAFGPQQAFYLRSKDHTCGCSSGSCLEILDDVEHVPYEITKRPTWAGWRDAPWILKETVPGRSCGTETSLAEAWIELLNSSADPGQECASHCVQRFSPFEVFTVADGVQCTCHSGGCPPSSSNAGSMTYEVIGPADFVLNEYPVPENQDDMVFLPEGPFPERLDKFVNPGQECAARCTRAYGPQKAIYLSKDGYKCSCTYKATTGAAANEISTTSASPNETSNTSVSPSTAPPNSKIYTSPNRNFVTTHLDATNTNNVTTNAPHRTHPPPTPQPGYPKLQLLRSSLLSLGTATSINTNETSSALNDSANSTAGPYQPDSENTSTSINDTNTSFHDMAYDISTAVRSLFNKSSPQTGNKIANTSPNSNETAINSTCPAASEASNRYLYFKVDQPARWRPVHRQLFFGGSKENERKCRDWHRKEPDPTWASRLPACPPIIPIRCEHHFIIGPRLTVVDAKFEHDSIFGCRFPRCESKYHPGAAGCLRSVGKFPGEGPDFKGNYHGQQCCYNAGGHLLTTIPAAGTADREEGKWTNFRDHQKHDVEPAEWCCDAGEDNELCRLYYEKRPLNNGHGYVDPPGGLPNVEKELQHWPQCTTTTTTSTTTTLHKGIVYFSSEGVERTLTWSFSPSPGETSILSFDVDTVVLVNDKVVITDGWGDVASILTASARADDRHRGPPSVCVEGEFTVRFEEKERTADKKGPLYRTRVMATWRTFPSYQAQKKCGPQVDYRGIVSYSNVQSCRGTKYITLSSLHDSAWATVSPQIARYGHNMWCEWRVETFGLARGLQVRMAFRYLDLEMTTTGKCHDGLKLFDGPSRNSEKQDICGNALPDPWVSTQNGLTLRFTSDSTGAGYGFAAKFIAVKDSSDSSQDPRGGGSPPTSRDPRTSCERGLCTWEDGSCLCDCLTDCVVGIIIFVAILVASSCR